MAEERKPFDRLERLLSDTWPYPRAFLGVDDTGHTLRIVVGPSARAFVTPNELRDDRAFKGKFDDSKGTVQERVRDALVKHGVIKKSARLEEKPGNSLSLIALTKNDLDENFEANFKKNRTALKEDIDKIITPLYERGRHIESLENALFRIGRLQGGLTGYGDINPRIVYEYDLPSKRLILDFAPRKTWFSSPNVTREEYAAFVEAINKALPGLGAGPDFKIETLKDGRFAVTPSEVTPDDLKAIGGDILEDSALSVHMRKEHPQIFDRIWERQITEKALNAIAPKDVTFHYDGTRKRFTASTPVTVSGFALKPVKISRRANFDPKPYKDINTPFQADSENGTYITEEDARKLLAGARITPSTKDIESKPTLRESRADFIKADNAMQRAAENFAKKLPKPKKEPKVTPILEKQDFRGRGNLESEEDFRFVPSPGLTPDIAHASHPSGKKPPTRG